MTNLTEQWKKGELPEGWYYIKDEDGQTIISEYYAELIDRETNETECAWSCLGEPEQVLAPVPSWEEYQKLLSDQLAKNEGEEINAELEAENTKLKELLKRARGLMNYTKDWACSDATEEMITKIDQVLGEE